MKTYINLLPWDYRLRRLIRVRIRQWSLLGGLTVVCLAALWWQQRDDQQAVAENAQSLKQRYAAIQRLQAETVHLQTQLNDLERQESLTGKLRNQGRGLTLVGLVSTSAARCGGKIRVQQFTFDDNRMILDGPAASTTATPSSAASNSTAAAKNAATPSTPAAQPASHSLLSLKGTAADNLAVAAFVVGLRDAGLFERVDLKSVAEGPAQQAASVAYTVECGL